MHVLLKSSKTSLHTTMVRPFLHKFIKTLRRYRYMHLLREPDGPDLQT
jgi:hypothetical protein